MLLALAVLTVVLLALSAWRFSRLAAESSVTSGEARLTASILLNLVMFGFSLIAALGTAFLAGPTLSGETESGIAPAVLARRSGGPPSCWASGLGWFSSSSPAWPSASSSGRWWATGHRSRRPPSRCSRRRPSTLVSPMGSGVVAVSLFGTTCVAGVVRAVGGSLGNEAVERVGTVSRMLLPTDGLWRGAMHAFQDPTAPVEFGGSDAEAFPFLSAATLTAAYLTWAAVWVAMVWALAAASFLRKDL